MPTLTWIGKEAVQNHHNEIPYRLLHCDESLSVGDPGTANLLVQGDNLHALKALLPYYAGQVKCIYIDPPYNTGNEGWVYNDNVNAPEIRKWLGKVVGSEVDDLCRHDKWLCMMYPRIALLRDLLSEDGAIFVSIDDTEVAHLRSVMDDLFGKRNFIANIVWQKKQSPQNDAINLSDMHDHILVYAKRAKADRKDASGWQRLLLPKGDDQAARYSNPDNDPRGAWTSADYTCNKTEEERHNLFYTIINPNTKREIKPSRRRVWAYDEAAHARNLAENRIWWGTGGNGRPRIKKFKAEVAAGVVPSTWWTRDFAGDNQEARREMRSLFGETEVDFATPKPTRLIARILQIATDGEALILDSFSGSGSTGHAILQQNHQDGGNRRFILVELEPEICRDITRERLKRVIEGYSGNPGLGGGFRYCTLGEPLFDEKGQIRSDVRFADLARHVFFTETGEPRPEDGVTDSPLIGVSNGIGYYLLFNGILGDKKVNGGNVLTGPLLKTLPPHDGPKVIFGEGCRIGASRLKDYGITFRQIPYEVKVN